MNKYSLRTSCNIVCYKSTFVFFVKDTANALAWLCMIIQSIRYVILTSGLHALAGALAAVLIYILLLASQPLMLYFIKTDVVNDAG